VRLVQFFPVPISIPSGTSSLTAGSAASAMTRSITGLAAQHATPEGGRMPRQLAELRDLK